MRHGKCVLLNVLYKEGNMSEDIEKINEIFRKHDELTQANIDTETAKKAARKTPVDKLFIDEDNEKSNYTGDEESERDFHPVRQSHESKTGCLGGLMYFVFVLCLSVIFACVAWMAASDALALNKRDFEAEVSLPTEIFSSEAVETTDKDGKSTGTERITHADVDYVASELKEAGLIEYKWLFKGFCKLSHADRKLDPGTYVLKSSYDYRAIIQNMRIGAGGAVTVSVTIPEGFTMQQIFNRLQENNVCQYSDLMEAAANYTYNYGFLEGVEMGDASRLEGFLFPDTYEFYVGMQASSAINKFLETFYYKDTQELQDRAAELGYSMNDIVKIASLIEKEAANDEERPLIASVIYNRLRTNTALGLESAILYLHQDHEGAPDAEMINEESPYNLLISTGLPPTPICSPGMASINSALYPASTNYIYFTLDTATGTHRFFTNYNDFANFAATQNYG